MSCWGLLKCKLPAAPVQPRFICREGIGGSASRAGHNLKEPPRVRWERLS